VIYKDLSGSKEFMKMRMSELVSNWGVTTSHSTHNRSFQRRVYSGNRLHWQPKTRKQTNAST